MHALSRRLVTGVLVGAAFTGLYARPAGASTAPHLNYYGGRVITNVKVDVVLWGSWSYPTSVPLNGSRSITSFFRGITASRYIDWLDEYATSTQHIRRGSLEGVYTVRAPSSAAWVTSTQIQSGLRSLMNSGKLPKANTSRVYVVFFRSGQTIFQGQANSAHDFCAYHDTMSYGSQSAYIAVIPYELNNRGCKVASTSFDSITTVVSHELVEAITDPGVGLHQLSWYDRRFGEIGDICAHTSTPGSVTGGDGVHYVVQREWSNRARACILTR